MKQNDDDVNVGPTLKMVVMCGLLFVILGCGLIWLVQGNEFFLYKVFAPRQEDVRREVFENTRSFVQGTIQELENYQMEYVKADDKHKQMLASLILRRASDVPESEMPVDLGIFINDLKRERGLVK